MWQSHQFFVQKAKMLLQLINIINTFGSTNSYHPYPRPLPQSSCSHRVIATVLVSSRSLLSCHRIVQSVSSLLLHHCSVMVTGMQLLRLTLAHPPPVHRGRRAGWWCGMAGTCVRQWFGPAPCFHGVAQQSGGPCRLGREVGGLIDRQGIVGWAVEVVVMAWQH